MGRKRRFHSPHRCCLLLCQFDPLPVGLHIAIAIPQHAPLADLCKASLCQIPDRRGRDLRRLEVGHRQRLLRGGRQEFQQMELGFFPLVSFPDLTGQLTSQHHELLIAGIIALLGRILLAQYLILYELFQDGRQFLLDLRQGSGNRIPPLGPLVCQILIDHTVHRHLQQDMAAFLFHRLILYRYL